MRPVYYVIVEITFNCELFFKEKLIDFQSSFSKL